MAKGYFTTKISENLEETPEGFLIAKNCVIARTGWQTYTIKDLPQQKAEDLGVDVSNPGANIDLYRRPEDVFHPDTIRSFEGKDVTDNHPEDFVDPDNHAKVSKGHVQNVRKGAEALESGDWPLVADVHVKGEPLLSKVRNKTVRELSCGYDFGIEREGDKICQTDIIGNHVAVVAKGRAGEEARINDHALESESVVHAADQKLGTAPSASEEVPAPAAKAAPVYTPIAVNFHKEKHPVAAKKQSWLRSLMGKHLIEMARATDADPDKIMDAAEAMHEEGKDGEVPPELKENQFKPKADDKKAKDDAETPKNTGANEFKSEDKKGAKDAETEKREAMHAALDRMLDSPAKDSKAKDSKAKDSDVEELKSLLDEFLDEEEDEPEHDDVADADPTALEAVLKGEDEVEVEVCPDCGELEEVCECPDEEELASGELALDSDEDEGDKEDDEEDDDNKEDVEDDEDEDEEPVTDKRKAKDKAKDKARATDGVKEVLKMLRPSIARSKDAVVRKAFDTAVKSVNKVSRASSGGGYGQFAGAARARDGAPRNPNPERSRGADSGVDPIAKMQDFYNKAHKGVK